MDGNFGQNDIFLKAVMVSIFLDYKALARVQNRYKTNVVFIFLFSLANIE